VAGQSDDREQRAEEVEPSVGSRRLVGDLTQEHEDDTDDHNLGHEGPLSRATEGEKNRGFDRLRR